MRPLAPIQSLLGRRGRRGTWAYALWLIPYLVTAWLFAGEMAFHAGAQAYQMLPLLFPVLVVVAQVFYPTLLGWAVIFIPSVAYCCFGAYYLIRHAAQKPPQWQTDPEGFVLGSFFLGAYLFVCVCLFFARPRRTGGTTAETVATPNGGPTAPFRNSRVAEGRHR